MRYSMMSYTIARQGPSVFDLNRMLRLTRELGLAGVDFVTLHGETALDLRKRCDDHGVPVVAHTIPGSGLIADTPEAVQKAQDAIRKGVADAVVLGAPVIMVVTPGRPDLFRSESRNRYIRGLVPILNDARAAGVTVTVENFPGKHSPFVTASDFHDAVEQLDDLYLTFDSGNAASGEEPAASFRRCAHRVRHAHFKDWTVLTASEPGGNEMRNGLRYKPALIGEGVLNHAAVLRAMAQAGYAGCINIEYEGSENPYEAIRRAVETLLGLG